MLRVLVIAPDHPDLPDVQAEAAAIANRHHVNLLFGDVREADVRNAIQGHRYDVIWFITHGDDERGLLLSDGWMDADTAARYVEQAGARLAVLSTCSSRAVAEAVVKRSKIADAICAVTEIEDKKAAQMGIGLSDRLDGSMKFYAAYAAARPTGHGFEYVVNPEKLKRMYHSDGDAHSIDQRLADLKRLIEQTNREYRDRLGELEAWAAQVTEIIDGTPKWDWSGVRAEFKTLQIQLQDALAEMEDKLEEALGSIQLDVQAALSSSSRPPGFVERHRWKFMMAIMVIVAVATIFTAVAIVTGRV